MKKRLSKHKAVVFIFIHILVTCISIALLVLGVICEYEILEAIACGFISSCITAIFAECINNKYQHKQDEKIIEYVLDKTKMHCKQFINYVIENANNLTENNTDTFFEGLQTLCEVKFENDKEYYCGGKIILNYLERLKNTIEQDTLRIESILNNSFSLGTTAQLNKLVKSIEKINNSTIKDLFNDNIRDYSELFTGIKNDLVPNIIEVFPTIKEKFYKAQKYTRKKLF